MDDVMAAVEEAERESAVVRCRTCQWLAGREPAERAQWDEVMADKTRATTPIHRAMKRFGFEYGVSSALYHRNDHTGG